MDNRKITRSHNIEILKNLGYSQIGNSSVFKKGTRFLLSPAVSEGEHGKYWIDIREVNLRKVNKSNCFLLVRIVPNIYILEKLKSLARLLSPKLVENRPNSGNVWGIYMKLKKQDKSATLLSKSNSNISYYAELIDKKSLFTKYSKIL